MMKPDMPPMGRSKLAKAAGVNLETVRFYEQKGLMPEPARSAVGYRQYEANDLKRLRFIRRAKELGFSIEETRALLVMADGDSTCSTVKSFAEDHISSIENKITDLKKMQHSLAQLAKNCADGRSPECAIIESLMAD